MPAELDLQAGLEHPLRQAGQQPVRADQVHTLAAGLLDELGDQLLVGALRRFHRRLAGIGHTVVGHHRSLPTEPRLSLSGRRSHTDEPTLPYLQSADYREGDPSTTMMRSSPRATSEGGKVHLNAITRFAGERMVNAIVAASGRSPATAEKTLRVVRQVLDAAVAAASSATTRAAG